MDPMKPIYTTLEKEFCQITSLTLWDSVWYILDRFNARYDDLRAVFCAENNWSRESEIRIPDTEKILCIMSQTWFTKVSTSIYQKQVGRLDLQGVLLDLASISVGPDNRKQERDVFQKKYVNHNARKHEVMELINKLIQWTAQQTSQSDPVGKYGGRSASLSPDIYPPRSVPPHSAFSNLTHLYFISGEFSPEILDILSECNVHTTQLALSFHHLSENDLVAIIRKIGYFKSLRSLWLNPGNLRLTRNVFYDGVTHLWGNIRSLSFLRLPANLCEQILKEDSKQPLRFTSYSRMYEESLFPRSIAFVVYALDGYGVPVMLLDSKWLTAFGMTNGTIRIVVRDVKTESSNLNTCFLTWEKVEVESVHKVIQQEIEGLVVHNRMPRIID